jgi:hypothetical protein
MRNVSNNHSGSKHLSHQTRRTLAITCFVCVFVVQSAFKAEGQNPTQPIAETGTSIPADWLRGSAALNEDAVHDTDLDNDRRNRDKNKVRDAGTSAQGLNPHSHNRVLPAAHTRSQATKSPLFDGKIDPAAHSTISPVARTAAAGEVIGFTSSDGQGSQTITLVHTGKSWMAVYHIDRSGTIQLVSSRPIDADFTLQLNATSPLPDDIREMGKR